MQNCVDEHCIVESKPDSEVHDLRIGEPWPQLETMAAALDLASLDETQHSHIPYGTINISHIHHYYIILNWCSFYFIPFKNYID